MEIKTNPLNPKITLDDVDVYLPRGIKALELAGADPIGLFRIFQRHQDARFFGLQEYLSALVSTMSDDDIARTFVWAVPEGYKLARHEAAVYMEGPAKALMINETLLHFLSTGTRFRTLAADYPGSKYPWVFMGARYLAFDDLAIATRAFSLEGILSTVPSLADLYIGTESHSQIAMWGGLKLDGKTEMAIAAETSNKLVAATIRATIAFHRANPDVPLYVLGDFAARSVGCFETFRATASVCSKLGIALVGGRMDISKADLNDEPLFDRFFADYYGQEIAALEQAGYKVKDFTPLTAVVGMKPMVVANIRHQLDQAGMQDFKLVVSSGIKLAEIDEYVHAGASIVGIGEEAAYYLNKGECNFTSDAVGYIQDGKLVPFAKEGRELSRVVKKSILDYFRSGKRLSTSMERINLSQFKKEAIR